MAKYTISITLSEEAYMKLKEFRKNNFGFNFSKWVEDKIVARL